MYLYYKYKKHIKRIIYTIDGIIVFRSVHIESYDIYYKIYKCRRDQYEMIITIVNYIIKKLN